MSVEHGTWSHGNRRYSVAFVDGQLFIARQDQPNLVGGITRGMVDRIVGTAAFVKLPNGAMGYLEKAKQLKPGEKVLVQVSTYAPESKAWPLSREIKLSGHRNIYLPHGKGIAVSKRMDAETSARLKEEFVLDFPNGLPGGWIIRSGGYTLEQRFAGIEERKSLVEQATLLNQEKTGWLIAPPTVIERAQLETLVFDLQELDAESLADRMESLLRLDIPLQGGGRLRLGPTPALFTIDIDAGTQTNMNQLAEEAAVSILHMLRSRAVTGQIVIDPVRAATKDLLDYLKFFGQGMSQLTIHGLTKMGLIELSRPRLGSSLYEALDG